MKPLLPLILIACASGAPRRGLDYFPQGKIVGGEDADYGEFPHLVALLRGGPGGSLMCGGSILSETWVVTAGHCCDGQSATRLGVRAGSWHLHEEDADQAEYSVKRVLLHEDYDSWTINNDICLLEIDGVIEFNEHVNKIGLPLPLDEPECGALCWVTGWGTTSEGGHLSDVLQKVQVPVVCDEECRDAYGENDISDNMICAGSAGKDSCQGDSGGPLMCGQKPTDELTGIVSWGYGCGAEGFPGVYTQASYFVSWINSNMMSTRN